MVIPYYKGLSESLKKICSKHGSAGLLQRRQYHQEPPGGSKRSRSYPKKRVESYTDTNVAEWNVIRNIYESPQEHLERFREHQKAPSPIYDLFNTSGHNVTTDNFSIVGREDQNLSRAIKEALYIRVNNPSLNRNIGKYPFATHMGWGSA